METVESLRDRYIAMNGARPASAEFLANLEAGLGVRFPDNFRKICEFFDGSGLNAVPIFSLAGDAPRLNPLAETRRLRNAIGLPVQYIAIAEPAEGLIVMDCNKEGRTLWLDSTDARNIATEQFKRSPDTWESFLDFFCYLLEEEEAGEG